MVPRQHARRTRGCAGATCTRRPSSPTTAWSTRTARRGRDDPEYELLDTGVFDDGRYWEITARLRQGRARGPADPHHRPQRRPGHRDARTCCRRCGFATRGRGRRTAAQPADQPARRGAGGRPRRAGPPMALELGFARRALFCDNETNARRAVRRRRPPARRTPRTAINDHVIARRGHRQPGAAPAPRRRSITGSTVAARRVGDDPAAAARRRSRRRRRGRRLRRGRWRPASARPTSSTPS